MDVIDALKGKAMAMEKGEGAGQDGFVRKGAVYAASPLGLERRFERESCMRALRIVLRPAGANPLDHIAVPDNGFTVGRKLPPFSSEPNGMISRLSKQHARIYQDGGQAYVADLGSLNGTYLNDLKLSDVPARLASGDELDFGGVFQFAVEVEEQPLDDRTVFQTYSPIKLNLVPEPGSALETLVISRFPFLVSRNDDAFQAAKEVCPEAIQEVSRKHALITLRNEQLFIEDLGSTNGTFIGDTKIETQPHRISAGDQLRFGEGLAYRVEIRGLDEDRTIISAGDLVLRGDLPVKADNPVVELDSATLAESGVLVPGHRQHELAREFRRAKQLLLQNLHAAPEVKPKNLVLVTSSLPEEGKTFVALNLALSLAAEMDHCVLLVDCDPATHGLSRMLGIEEHPGIVDKLAAGETNVERCILRTNVEQLHLLASGASVEHLHELYASHLMNELLLGLLDWAPNMVIVFDGPPLITTSEAAVLARSMGQTVLVVEEGKTPTKVVEQAASQLEGCQCVSGLLNKVKGSHFSWL